MMPWPDLGLWGLALALSLAVLVKAADVFIGSAERVGLHLGLSRFIIGVSLIAFGTSLPELLTSVLAVLRGDTGIAAGTVVGSNVANILLILSVAAIVGGGLRVQHELLRVDLPFLFGSALLLALFAFDGVLGRLEGLLSLAALSVYVAYAVGARDGPGTTMGLLEQEVQRGRPRLAARVWGALLMSGVLIQVAAWGTVESVTRISSLAGIGQAIIAASVVAVGTSLPELAVSVRAARAGNPEVAVGNVIGSNIFNALGVLGAAALVGNVAVPPEIASFALPAMIGATILCFFVVQDREMTAWDGWLLLVLFVGFNLQLYEAS